MKHRGFGLIELLIVVTLIGILAAIAVPAVIRSRIAANEAATIADVRTVVAAQAAYATVNVGFYDSALTCLNAPSAGCIPNYPPTAPTFLDSGLAALLTRSEYNRTLHPRLADPNTVPATASASSATGYVYQATPLTQGVTGVRGFAADASGRICWTPDGSMVLEGGPGELDPNCQILD